MHLSFRTDTCSIADANGQLKTMGNEMNSMKSQLKLALGELAGQDGEGQDGGHKVSETPSDMTDE